MPKVLVTGAAGQIGSELVAALKARYGDGNVVATDKAVTRAQAAAGVLEPLDVMHLSSVERAVRAHNVDTIYHLAAILSAVGETNPDLAWDVNMGGLKNILDVSTRYEVARVFWPSSIGVFGPDAQKAMAPQNAPLNPTTMYGITKVAGELMSSYYSLKHGLDVRSVRFPGLVSSDAKPGGGTTDYAVEIFYSALQSGRYTCFLREDTTLPMMYMPDALRGAIELMEADAGSVKLHRGYNLAAMSFSAGRLASEIKKHLPGFVATYSPDSRQAIADSWPKSIDDSAARRDWGWKEEYDLPAMVTDMLSRLGRKLSEGEKTFNRSSTRKRR
ncbi:MAG: NAD-dependent epimerase/dehydratase family protein [Nitrososphaerota archaeon]|nr:NAD-dependent epimerase/dehydratase family protein [Nitrososphaerota archaeon]MDG7024206.1 NAD-dependent epimerase/dehydratase family protein [Nitrososphaerota archaeon]